MASFLALVTGCADDPPAGHKERLHKAAGVAAFKITCTKDMWERTTAFPNESIDSFQDAKPRKSDGAAGGRGLVEVTLTGSQLVDYLQQLNDDMSGGLRGRDSVEPMSRRMYEALAPVVDQIQKNAPLTKVPAAIVDDAVVPAGPEVSPTASTNA
ncbi:hypothetical protein [Streptomyces sp. NBC_00826]|uniref:hypothetical protein n=1 Tax=Streptomyces sp. NBC_00826 TaxID=2975845 RepID=UPI002F9191FA|nr:hypothetical protein OG832_44850 [Streptomyces sp. NBC_00826]WTB60578.1 hypothetical protein OG832_47050 [Streptomyces sp. NBC_00826]